tara:strand:+ start:2396 stop:2974 length:579 start_codon:yes stop_codon:yes gene_type:complete
MKKFFLIFASLAVINTNQVLKAEEGMPQLNPEYWGAQIFWLILVFFGLYLAIWKIFLPKITNTIENRKSRVINDLNETERLKENAEKKLEEYNKIIDEIKKEAKKIIDENKKKLENDIKSKNDKFNKEMEKELSVIEKEINDLKKTSISDINKIATEIASDVIKTLIKTETNQSSVSAIVEDVSKKRIKNYL